MGNIIQSWECRVCDKNAPCRVEIHTSDDGLPEHLKGNSRFRKKWCMADERLPFEVDWKRQPDVRFPYEEK